MLREDLRPDELVERVVPTDVLAQREELALRREQPRRVEAAGLVERLLGGAEQVRQGEQHAAVDDRAVRDGLGADGDLVERGLAADPAGRRRDEVPLRDDARVERPGEADRDPVVGLVHLAGVAGLEPQDLRAVDQALGLQEARRELVLEARGPHRDRDRDRVLAGTRGPDLERLLADDAVAAELEVGAADGHDPGRRDVAGRRRRRLRHWVTLELVMMPAPSYAVIFVDAVASGHHDGEPARPAERRDDRPVVGEGDDDARDAGTGPADDRRHRVGAVAARRRAARPSMAPGGSWLKGSPDDRAATVRGRLTGRGDLDEAIRLRCSGSR